MTLLVIAGAGASYDGGREFPIEGNGRYAVSADFEYYRPPLAKDLFEWHPSETPYFEAIARYPRAAPAVDRLRAWVQEGISVEDGLGRLGDERFLGSEANAQLAAIRYYLRWTIGGVEERWREELNHVTNYLTLIDRLARHYHETARATPVRIVTFNYDTLIDRALTDVLHARFGTIEDYTSRPDSQLFKPHGSVNWLRKAAVHSDDWQRPGPTAMTAACRPRTTLIDCLAGDDPTGEEPLCDSGLGRPNRYIRSKRKYRDMDSSACDPDRP